MNKQGINLVLDGSADAPIQGLRLYGKSTQDGTPSPENPVPIVSAGEEGEINVTVSDGGTQSQTLTISTPGGLPGIPVSSGGNYTDESGQQWVCDEVDFKGGKYVQRVKDFIINRNTNISTSLGIYGAPEKDTILARYSDETIKKRGAVLCRELICVYNWNNDSESVFATETSIDFRLSRKRLGLGTDTTTDENKTEVLKFLETTPLHCLVELNTPIETDLPAEEISAYKALHTYSPTTTVSNDAGAWMYVKYLMNDDIPTGPHANPRSEVAQYYRALAGYDKSYPKSTCRETALIKCLIDGSLDPPFTEAKCTIEAYLLDIINNTRTMMNYEPKCDCEKFLAMMIGKEVVDYPQLNCEHNLWMSKCVEKKALTEALRNGLI